METLIILRSVTMSVIQSNTMETIDLILATLRYSPLFLITAGTLMLIVIQYREAKAERRGWGKIYK